MWRYRCPKGHTTWRSRDSGFNESAGNYWCESCGGHFKELVDMKEPAERHVADPEVEAV